MKIKPHIRLANIDDLPKIVDIYNQAIVSKKATGDLKEFSINDRIDWFQKSSPDQYPIYVAELKNTIVGYAGKAYREGYTVLVSVTFMMSVIGGYRLFAPKLYKLSRKLNFITIGDYIQHRYNSRVLTVFAVTLLILALGNFILTNLKAIGHIVEASTGGQIPFVYGVLALSLIMVIYETWGG